MFLSLVLPALCLTHSAVATPLVDFNLKSVYVVSRHGDSIPVTTDFYPNHPEAPHDFNPHAKADLTKNGKMRSYKFGQFLRSRYSDFIGEVYRRKDVYARSTYPERAQESLLLILAGLYPPQLKQRWHRNLDWQPIPIETPRRFPIDKLMWPSDCPLYKRKISTMEYRRPFAPSMERMVNIFVKAANVSNLHPDLTEEQLTDIYNKLRFGVVVNASVWNNVYLSSEIARNTALIRYHMQNYNHELVSINGGWLLEAVNSHMNGIMNNGTSDKKQRSKKSAGINAKIQIYGGQEFNVVAFLYALGAWQPIVPYYSSAVIVELWEKDSNYYVKILYYNGLTGEIQARKIDGCEKMCPYENFHKLRRHYIPSTPIESYDCADWKCSIAEDDKSAYYYW